MPLSVIDGALCTHPVVRVGTRYAPNAFYDCGVHSLRAADPAVVASRLDQLHTLAAGFGDQLPVQREGLRRSAEQATPLAAARHQRADDGRDTP